MRNEHYSTRMYTNTRKNEALNGHIHNQHKQSQAVFVSHILQFNSVFRSDF